MAYKKFLITAFIIFASFSIITGVHEDPSALHESRSTKIGKKSSILPNMVDTIDHGFLRIDQNKRYFVFDDGTSYIPVGVNDPKLFRQSQSTIDSKLESYAEHGINYLRIWIDYHVHEFENPIGNYGATFNGQVRLHTLDYIINRAEELGIYISLCFFDENGVINEGVWKNYHPYNSVRGGPAQQQSDMYDTTHTASWNAIKNRYKFIVDRYENKRSIMMWDIINDTHKTPAWKNGMYDFVRNEDANDHIITLQYNTWIVPVGEMDCSSVRVYNKPEIGNDAELMADTLRYRINEALKGGNPVYVGEGRMGYNVEGSTQYDLERGFLHLLWGALASGAAGNTHWWVEGNNSRPDLSDRELDWMLNFSRFCKTIDWKNFNSINVNNEVHSDNNNVVPFACRDDDEMLLYLMNDDSTKQFNELNTTITIEDGLINQLYYVAWIDIRTGNSIRVQKVKSVPFTLEAPTFKDGIFAYISTTPNTTGTNFYIDKNATGSNEGSSWTNAWTSFASIDWSILEPGDTVKISGGTDSLTYYETLIISASGDSSNPIVITGTDDIGHNGQVIINGDNTRETGIKLTNRKNLVIKNFKVTNHTNLDIAVSGASGSTYTEQGASSYVTLENIELNVTGRALHIQTSDHITVKNCYIYTPTYIPKQTDGIYSQRNLNNVYDNNTIIINNTHKDGHDDGIQMYQDVSITVSNNYIEQNNGKVGNAQGIYATNGHGNNVWYNNVVVLSNGTTSNGITYRLNLDGTIAMISNTVFCERAFNTMWIEDVPNPVIKNNILWNDYLAAPLTLINWNGNPANIDNNLLYGPNISEGIVKNTDQSWLSWDEYRALGFDAHGINAHPQFVDVGAKDFSLKPTSPAIDAGAVLGSPYDVDKNGIARPVGSGYDMGAYEYPQSVTGIKVDKEIPSEFRLEQNYPNPFNPSTTISFVVPHQGEASLKIYDIKGSEVAEVFNETIEAGKYYQVKFDASGLASGVYLYTLAFGHKRFTKKLMLIK